VPPNSIEKVLNRKLITKSGIVVLKTNGDRAAVHDENAIIEVDTPFHARVALLRKECETALKGEIPIKVENAHHRWDQEVLDGLKKLASLDV
jgi:hypothetical protein